MKKKILIALTSFLVLLLILVAWFISSVIYSPVGPPNPPISESAVCNIVKNEEETFIVTCTNNDTLLGSSPLYVAQSKADLNKYLGKKVQIKSSFLMNKNRTDSVTTNIQCIRNQCKPMFKDKNQKTYGIVIESIKEL